MSKGLKDKVDINKIEPSPRTNEETLHVWLTDEEKKYLSKMAQIMSKLKVNETNSTLIPDKTLASLGKMALNFLAYCKISGFNKDPEYITRSAFSNSFFALIVINSGSPGPDPTK